MDKRWMLCGATGDTGALNAQECAHCLDITGEIDVFVAAHESAERAWAARVRQGGRVVDIPRAPQPGHRRITRWWPGACR